MDEKNCEALLEYVLDISSQMVECGAEARRAENTALRLVTAYGMELRCANAISSMVEVCIKAPDGRHYTQTVRVLSTGTDLGRLERLNAIARKICAEKPPVEEIGAMLEEERRYRYPRHLEFIGYVVMTFALAIFFGGNGWDGLCAALISVLVFVLNHWLNNWLQASQNRLFYTFLASLLSGLLAILLVYTGLGQHYDKIMIGDLMLFIPGLTLVNGMRDLLYRDIITGLYRLIEALMLTLCIAGGFGIAIVLLGGMLP